MLTGENKTRTEPPVQPKAGWKSIGPHWLSLAGLVLIIITGVGWLLSFPTLNLIETSLTHSGYYNPALFADRPLPPTVAFFRNYPQILWLGFILGTVLFFGLRPSRTSLQTATTSTTSEIWGLKFTLPGWTNLLWRLAGIAGLAVILIIAANFRIGNARDVGATDLIRTDYDEGVYASSALLMAQGSAIHKDFFSTPPPVGPLIWSIPLRLEHGYWGGLMDFLRLRLFNSLVALVTIALAYLIGRKLGGRWAGPLAGGLAALTLAVDGSAIRTEQQIMLEPLINLFTATAIWIFVEAEAYRLAEGKRPRWLTPALIIGAGGFAGIALSVKVPALAVGLALGLTLLIWRRWKYFGFYIIGLIGGYLLTSGYFLLTVGSSFIKQAYLYQFLRPFNRLSVTGEFQPETTLTAFDYFIRTPYLAFTMLSAALGLVAIVMRWATRGGGEKWLPVALVAVVTTLLYTGKAGFFPHYYDHLALPLALMAGGVVNFWRVEWWQHKIAAPLSALGVLVVGLILVPALQRVGDDPSRPEWSQERAVLASFQNLGLDDDAPTLTWDARYSFILGAPMPKDSYNQYLVDSAAYVEYLALGLGDQHLATVAKKAILENSKTANGDMRQLRYTPQVQNDLFKAATNANYILIEARAESQLTPESEKQFKTNFINRLDGKDIDIFSTSRAIRYSSGALFGSKMRLVGFDTQPEIKASAWKLPLTVFWRSETKIDENYVIFIHLLNAEGQTVAQRDTAPRYGALNTTQWTPGALLDDDQSLQLPPNLPPGTYKVEIGVYRPTDGQRLILSEVPPAETKPDSKDSMILTEIKITGS